PALCCNMRAEAKLSVRILKISRAAWFGRRSPLIAQTRFLDFPLRGGDVVRQTVQFEHSVDQVVSHVSCLLIIVSRLTDGAAVYEVLFAGLDFEPCVGASSHNGIADEGDRDVRVSEEAKIRLLAREAHICCQFVEHVSPPLWGLQCRMDDSEVSDLAHVRKAAQPLTIIGGKLLASPFHGLQGFETEIIEGDVGRTVFVMVTFNARSIHCAHDIDARLGVGAIPDKIPEECIMSASLLLCVFQYCLERFEVGMDVGYNRELHPAVPIGNMFAPCRTCCNPSVFPGTATHLGASPAPAANSNAKQRMKNVESRPAAPSMAWSLCR